MTRMWCHYRKMREAGLFRQQRGWKPTSPTRQLYGTLGDQRNTVWNPPEIDALQTLASYISISSAIFEFWGKEVTTLLEIYPPKLTIVIACRCQSLTCIRPGTHSLSWWDRYRTKWHCFTDLWLVNWGSERCISWPRGQSSERQSWHPWLLCSTPLLRGVSIMLCLPFWAWEILRRNEGESFFWWRHMRGLGRLACSISWPRWGYLCV